MGKTRRKGSAIARARAARCRKEDARWMKLISKNEVSEFQRCCRFCFPTILILQRLAGGETTQWRCTTESRHIIGWTAERISSAKEVIGRVILIRKITIDISL